MTTYAWFSDHASVLNARSFLVNGVAMGISPINTSSQNVAAYNAAGDLCAANGIREIYIPEGTYAWEMQQHRNESGGGATSAMLVMKAGIKVRGAGPNRTILRRKNADLQPAGSQNRFVTNWDRNATVAVDTDIALEDLTLDGNCANNTTSGSVSHGIQFWNVRRAYVRRVVVKNMRGDDTSTLETFHIDFIRSQDVGIEDSRVLCDDGGATASGISMNFTDRFFVRGCSVRNMSHGQGYTYYASANGMTSDCFAGGNAAVGFNEEQCSDLTYVNCIAGAESARSDSATASAAYTHAGSNANDRAFVFLHTHGGGRIDCINCVARGSTTRNVGFTGAVAATTAASGTSGTTITLSTAVLYQPMVGNYISVNGGPFVRIVAVTPIANQGNSITCTTDAAHGGGNTQAVVILPGRVTFSGTITGSDKGVQFTNSTTALKQWDAQCFDVTGAKIYDNTTDLENVGNGSSTSVARASGQAPAAVTSNMASTVEFDNPFPCDMEVINDGGTAISRKGPHPKDTSVALGLTEGPVKVKCGGSITVTNGTMANVRWYFL